MKIHVIIHINQGPRAVIQCESTRYGYLLFSRDFICPVCRRIWAEILVGHHRTREFQATPCPEHRSACHPILSPVAGSILDNSTFNGWDEGLLEALPYELVYREFLLHVQSLSQEIFPCPQIRSQYHHQPSPASSQV